MSNIMIKAEIRKYLRNSSIQPTQKMVCPIVKLINMKYDDVDSKKVASLASELISERY